LVIVVPLKNGIQEKRTDEVLIFTSPLAGEVASEAAGEGARRSGR
jgi:hypothetical protein